MSGQDYDPESFATVCEAYAYAMAVCERAKDLPLSGLTVRDLMRIQATCRSWMPDDVRWLEALLREKGL